MPPTAILYLHGGGYVLGSAFGYRALAGALAMAAEAAWSCPSTAWRRSTRSPPPLTTPCGAYTWMLDRGDAPRQIVLAGDSSGGGLAMSLLVGAPAATCRCPAAPILMCPGIDLRSIGSTRRPRRREGTGMTIALARRPTSTGTRSTTRS